jgi:hypothetical protein
MPRSRTVSGGHDVSLGFVLVVEYEQPLVVRMALLEVREVLPDFDFAAFGNLGPGGRPADTIPPIPSHGSRYVLFIVENLL